MTLEDLVRGERIAYFAYGSCMNHASLSASLGCDVSRLFVGPAHLDGYRLAFNYASTIAPSCCANIEAETGATIEGALYDMPTELLEVLDRREGVGLGRYTRCAAEIRMAQAPARMALTYRGLVTLPYEAAPSERYRDLLVQGLMDAGVSEQYRLKTVALMMSLPARETVMT